MSSILALVSVTESDVSFLTELYASTRAIEMAIVPWTDEQKREFLRIQFEAQDQHYRERYPNASFEIIKLNEQQVGRLYQAELADEIRIIDLAFLPQYFNEHIFILLLKEILQKGEQTGKPVRIFLESFDPTTQIFINLGFNKIDEHGIHFLWERKPTLVKTEEKASVLGA
jgi:hypothetical protein